MTIAPGNGLKHKNKWESRAAFPFCWESAVCRCFEEDTSAGDAVPVCPQRRSGARYYKAAVTVKCFPLHNHLCSHHKLEELAFGRFVSGFSSSLLSSLSQPGSA